MQPDIPASEGMLTSQFEDSVLRQSILILRKDLMQEGRNRAALNSIALFAITSLFVIGFAGGVGEIRPATKAALLWVLLLFASMSGLQHVFMREEEANTAVNLRMWARVEAVLAGKLLFNLLLMLFLCILLVPAYALVLRIPVSQLPLFVASLAAGSLGLAVAATSVAAILAESRGRGALFGALGLPILMPNLILAIAATRQSLGDVTGGQGWLFVGGLLSFSFMMVVVGFILFPWVWED